MSFYGGGKDVIHAVDGSEWSEGHYYPSPRSKSLCEAEPETVIGETLQIEGKIRFERLLRLEGKFQGELLSRGDLVVGPRGEVVGDLMRMNEVVVHGKVIGNINVERLELCGSASIYGDITCKTLLMDPTVVLVGKLNVNPYAPQLLSKDGNIVVADEPQTTNNENVEDAMLNDDPQTPPDDLAENTENTTTPVVSNDEPDSSSGDAAEPNAQADQQEKTTQETSA